MILSVCRTPIGSFGGVLKNRTVADLGAVVVKEAVRRAGIDGADVDDVVLGCVLQAGAGPPPRPQNVIALLRENYERYSQRTRLSV